MKNLATIQSRVFKVVQNPNAASFIYDLLRAYDVSRASVSRLEKGEYNLARQEGEVLWKNRLFYSRIDSDRLFGAMEAAAERADVQARNPRFLIVTDSETLLSRDTKTGETLDTALKDLPARFEFFLPWAGVEKTRVFHENPADIKAAEKMAVLYDEIIRANPAIEPGSHDLNVFFARILFCLFAEDTGIFPKGIFSEAVGTYTAETGEDLPAFLTHLFRVLDTTDRDGVVFYLRDFPYVNGGLFEAEVEVPQFSRKARQILLESASGLDWSEINPDIFGSMIQAVVHEDQRGGLGMHYTSVPNIMKVIGPLFLDDLRDEFDRVKDSIPRLRRLLTRLSKMKFFDPACGSGNFLIVTYKEIRKLEMEIIARLEELKEQGELLLSQISLQQFYGIELDDFAHEVAILSLWLAEHQMNVAFQERFGRVQAYLPLKESGNIVQGNAARLDWEAVCPVGKDDEVYVMGNPPYLGFAFQSKDQKADKRLVFAEGSSYKKLDYIAIWFVKGARYIRGRAAQCAFVSTASVSQGEQVDLLWPGIFALGLEIGFAYRPFPWSNNARGKAAVSVVIVGIRNRTDAPKLLFGRGRSSRAINISPYLIPGSNLTVGGRSSPISALPAMSLGNKAFDFGHLIFKVGEKEEFLAHSPDARRYLRPLLGGDELLAGTLRWCLWIDDDECMAACSIPAIAERVQRVARDRAASSDSGTRALARRPHQFRDRNVAESFAIIVPETGSIRRDYIPVSVLPTGTIMSGNGYAIYDAEYWLIAMIGSYMHSVWMKTVGGRMKDDPRYGAKLCYNTFPFPLITDEQKAVLKQVARGVIAVREAHSEKTLADLYDPDLMPEDLRAAHGALDLAVDRCYRKKPFASDEERLQLLFAMYEQMTRAGG